MNPFFKIAIPLCMLLCISEVNGQGPGYLGKHAFIKADFGSMIALTNPTANNRGFKNYGNQQSSVGFNTNSGILFGYAVSRKHVLFAEAGYLKTGMIPEDIYSPSNFADGYLDSHYLFYNLTGKSVGIGCQWYNLGKGGLAPMGNYFSLALRKTWLKGAIVDKLTTYAYPEFTAEGHQPLGIDPEIAPFSIGAEYGQQIVIRDRILLGIAVALNIPLNLTQLKTYGVSSNDYTVENQSRFEHAAASRFFNHNKVLLKLSAGYLLF